MYVNHDRRSLRSPGGDSHDLFGAEFLGSPCHHRVLKPPGGGTSDIFGGSEAEKLVIRKKPVQASSIVLNDEAATNSGNNAAANTLGNGHAKQGTCNAGLFGLPLQGGGGGGGDIPNSVKCHKPKTNGEAIAIENDHTDSSVSAKPAMINRKITNGNGEMKNGIAAATIPAQSASRGRVPPGGYSTSLW